MNQAQHEDVIQNVAQAANQQQPAGATALTAPPTLKFLSTLKLGFYEKVHPEGRYGKRSSKITKMDALRESLRPPPSTADYREKVIAKLDDISEQLNAQLTKAAYPVGQGSAKTPP